MSNNRAQHKNWVFTLNHPVLPEVTALNSLVETNLADFLVYQYEQGESGTLHLQGYIQFSQRRRLTSVKKINGRAHWEPRRGTHEEAYNYCTKSETRATIAGPGPYEYGVACTGPGERSDLRALHAAVKAGKDMAAISEEFFEQFLRYRNGIRDYILLHRGRREWQTAVFVYHGPPGTGKSSRALHEAGPNAYWLRAPDSGRPCYWDGYDGQENVVIDEFYGWISIKSLCRLIDRYPYSVDQRGTSYPFLARRIWITSNKSPDEWYPNVGLPAALQRRLYGPDGTVVEMSVMRDTPWGPADALQAAADRAEPRELD